MEAKTNTKVVIFCGGKGSRMWPISSVGHPKQFDAIVGKTSFFRQTIKRVLKGFKPEDIFISTGKDFQEIIKKQASEIPSQNIIYEPEMRDNLGAVGLSAATIAHRFKDSVMVLLWGADHMIKKEAVFLKAIKKAAQLAYENKKIVHVDVWPTYPSVHNGWIKIGKKIKIDESYDTYEFVKQVEKPDLNIAKKFFKSGSYLIHTGYMATKPELLLEYYKKYTPRNYKIIRRIADSMGSKDHQKILRSQYKEIERTSVDLGVFTKLAKGTQMELPVDIGWVDMGTWGLLYHGLPKDKNGNVVIGKAELLDVKNCLVFSRDKKISGLINLSDMLVIDSQLGLLVCPMKDSPKVKQLYKQVSKKI